MSDKELARAVARDNEAAVLAFVKLYHPDMFRYMRSLGLRHEDAEDLAVETLLIAQRKVGSYRGESSLRTWIHRLAYRHYVRWNQKQKPTSRLPETLITGRNAHAAIDDAESLRGAIANLPDTLRQPFVLHVVNDMPLDEIAVILDVPVGTVKSRLHFARAKLRELLAPSTEESHVPIILESGRRTR